MDVLERGTQVDSTGNDCGVFADKQVGRPAGRCICVRNYNVGRQVSRQVFVSGKVTQVSR